MNVGSTKAMMRPTNIKSPKKPPNMINIACPYVRPCPGVLTGGFLVGVGVIYCLSHTFIGLVLR